jgi:hypothetical protein
MNRAASLGCIGVGMTLGSHLRWHAAATPERLVRAVGWCATTHPPRPSRSIRPESLEVIWYANHNA